jgi:hypothetical protein
VPKYVSTGVNDLAKGFFRLSGTVSFGNRDSLSRDQRQAYISCIKVSEGLSAVVGGALASWGPVVQLARSADVTTFHTTALGSWEVHSDVGLVSAGEDNLWGVLGLVGGDGLRCCFGMFRVQMG